MLMGVESSRNSYQLAPHNLMNQGLNLRYERCLYLVYDHASNRIASKRGYLLWKYKREQNFKPCAIAVFAQTSYGVSFLNIYFHNVPNMAVIYISISLFVWMFFFFLFLQFVYIKVLEVCFIAGTLIQFDRKLLFSITGDN